MSFSESVCFFQCFGVQSALTSPTRAGVLLNEDPGFVFENTNQFSPFPKNGVVIENPVMNMTSKIVKRGGQVSARLVAIARRDAHTPPDDGF